jgi:LDH2 family malate/lactate/ureidoglycolate dehydrogenase
MADEITHSAADLRSFVTDVFRAAGVLDEDAAGIAESLVEANLRGHDSHGVVRVWDYLRQLEKGELVAAAELRVLAETAAMLAVDAQLGFGQVQMRRLIDRLVPKARELGTATATVVNCGHVGRLGEWVERIAVMGLAGLMAVNDNGVLQCVAPPGGISPRISTNPIAIGVPTGGEPLVLDISTSTVANGKIKVAYLAGNQCPPGWLLDHAGNPTTDPAVRFKDPRGTIFPMGGEADGYKGFGLGFLLDILVGGLSGGFCPPAPPDAPGTNNVLLIVWEPARFAGMEHFIREADKLIGYARETPRKSGVDAIRLPGDRSGAIKAERLRNGITLDSKTWKRMRDAAAELGVVVPASRS